MIRFVIFAITGYLGYKIVRKLASSFFGQEISGPRPSPEVTTDELVQDPVCKVFVARRNALKATKDGQDYFFCSEGCRKRFLK